MPLRSPTLIAAIYVLSVDQTNLQVRPTLLGDRGLFSYELAERDTTYRSFRMRDMRTPAE